MEQKRDYETATVFFSFIATIVIGGGAVLLALGNCPKFVRADSNAVATATFEARVTAYCPCSKCCGKWADGITASGHKIRPGDKFVAAPKSIPFGTLVIVPGYAQGRPVPVLDRGSSITENKLDLYFDDADGKTGHQRALEWGVKNLEVTIVR